MGLSTGKKVNVTLPKNLYAVVGKELNVYFGNIVDTSNINKYDIDVVTDAGTAGKHYANNFNFIPTVAGNTALTINVYEDGKMVGQASTTIKTVTDADTVTTDNKIIIIGDSNIASDTIAQEFQSLYAADAGASTMSLLGTLGTAPAKHEGRNGWATSHYLTAASYNGSTNAFWDGSAFNFANYMTTTALAVPTKVIIALGTNDVWYVSTVSQFIANLKTMKDSIQGYNSNIKVCFALPIPPAGTQDPFGKQNSSDITRTDFKTKLHSFIMAMLTEFDGVLANVYVIPTNVNLDTLNNFPYDTIAVGTRLARSYQRISDQVHPAVEGKKQVADSHYYFLKNNQ